MNKDESLLKEADEVFVGLMGPVCEMLKKMYGPDIAEAVFDKYLLAEDPEECPLCAGVTEEKVNEDVRQYMQLVCALINAANEQPRK